MKWIKEFIDDIRIAKNWIVNLRIGGKSPKVVNSAMSNMLNNTVETGGWIYHTWCQDQKKDKWAVYINNKTKQAKAVKGSDILYVDYNALLKHEKYIEVPQ